MAADGHLGMTALSRVTLASARLSCHNMPTFSAKYRKRGQGRSHHHQQQQQQQFTTKNNKG